MDNLQKSEKVIAQILAHLMATGIQRSELHDETLQLDEELRPFFSQCVKWLIAEGIVNVDNISEATGGDVFAINPTNTSYGFQVLGQTLELDGSKTKLATAVQEVSTQGKSYSQIGDFVGGLLGGFTKSISS